MENIQEIFTDRIKLPPSNMRTSIDRDALHELSDDIKKNGLISPITVRPLGDDFELVAGQRRYLAHQIAGILKIRCVVRALSDDAIMTSENLARVDVNPVDEANHVGRLMTLHNGDIAKVAHIMSRGKAWVEDRIAVATMPDYLQEFLSEGRIKLGAALALVQITDDEVRRVWVGLAVRDGVSVAQALYWLEGWKMSQLPGMVQSELPPDGYSPSAPAVPQFECFVDHKKYDCRQFKNIMVHESNLPLLESIVFELRNQAPSI
jgi:ParB/RepB/Spo0J family partition protein